jgi:uncharacterized membrane protein YbhN (UPF0104 family)
MAALEPTPQTSRRAFTVGVLAIALVLGVAIAIGKAASYGRLLHELRNAETPWLALCLAGEVVRYGGYLVVYRAVARAQGGPVLRFGTALRVVAAGFGILIVATGAGALAVDYWALRRAGASPHEALARVLGLNTLEWAVLGVAATAAAAALLAGVPPGAPAGATLPWVAVVPACVAAAIWVTSPRRVGGLSDETRGGRVRRLLAAAVRGVALIRPLLSRPSAALAGALAYWAGDIVCLWAGMRAFGVHLGPAAIVLAYATGYVVAALPLPAGGAGGVDAAMTYALTLVGVPLAPALLGTLAYRLFNFWLPVVPALAVLPSMRRLARELPLSERAPGLAG